MCVRFLFNLCKTSMGSLFSRWRPVETREEEEEEEEDHSIEMVIHSRASNREIVGGHFVRSIC